MKSWVREFEWHRPPCSRRFAVQLKLQLTIKCAICKKILHFIRCDSVYGYVVFCSHLCARAKLAWVREMSFRTLSLIFLSPCWHLWWMATVLVDLMDLTHVTSFGDHATMNGPHARPPGSHTTRNDHMGDQPNDGEMTWKILEGHDLAEDSASRLTWPSYDVIVQRLCDRTRYHARIKKRQRGLDTGQL